MKKSFEELNFVAALPVGARYFPYFHGAPEKLTMFAAPLLEWPWVEEPALSPPD